MGIVEEISPFPPVIPQFLGRREGLRGVSLFIPYILSSLLWFTESQNHRIVGVGRDLCGSSSPTPLPKQGHLQQAAQDLVQAGLEYLQRRRLHNLPGQPVPVYLYCYFNNLNTNSYSIFRSLHRTVTAQIYQCIITLIK